MSDPRTTKIAVEEVALHRARLREINRLDFDAIEWTVKGEVAPVDIISREDWKTIGLNNTNFPEFYDFDIQKMRHDQ